MAPTTMHADIPVPAPASWVRPQQPTTWPQPTDKPVLRNELWFATRQIERASWHVCMFGDANTLNVLVRQAYVVDDYGSLQPVDDSFGSANHDYYDSTWCIDAAACDWMDAQCAAGAQARQQQALAQRTRHLLRPPPVTVEIVTEPADDVCVASIVLGADPRLDAPVYSVHAPHSKALLITHAQLCALVLAANQLVKASKPTGRLQ